MKMSQSCPRSRPVGTSKAPESRWNAKTGPNEVNGNVSPAAGNAKTFRFDLLPAELQAQIIQSLESSFFCENVRRLVVSKSWAHWALKAMYEDMVISKASNPLAPMRISGNDVNSGYVSASTNNLERHLRVVRLHLDHMFRSYQFLPDDTDLRQHKDQLTMMNRRKAACAGNEQRPMNTWSKLQPENEPTTIQSMLIMSVELMAYIYASQRVHTLDLKMREAWGLRRSHVSAFEAVLSVALVKKQLSHLQLDLAGLGAREQSCQSRTVERVSDANEPLPLHHLFGDRNVGTMNRALEMVDQWNQRHVCNGIMHALPHLETLHYRSRCICPGIFRWQLPEEMERWRQMWPSFDGWPAGISHAQALTEYGERAETALPKLKEVVINMALPRESFKHTRVVHCMTFDANLTREAENHYAEYAVKEMKREMTRFVRRLDHPRIVRLRYSRMVGTRLDREYIDEFDALTGETRTRPVDRWGEVVDLEE